MRVLLFEAPVATVTKHAQLSPPLGLAYLANHLERAGHRVRIVDLNLTSLSAERLTATLSGFRPELVGISAHTETYPGAQKIAQLVKGYDRDLPVVIGGPHATILPAEVLSDHNIDYVVVGEGERTLVELVAWISSGQLAEDLPAIEGLGHRVNGETALNAPRKPLAVGEIGRPARHLLSLEFYEDAHNVLAARGGCPYRCPFCSASAMWGGRRRPRMVEDIVAEVDELVHTYGARHVFFVDDILTVNRRWFEELMQALEPYKDFMTWGCATRVDCVDEALLQRMAEVGFSAIQYGVESGAQDILDSVKGIKKRVAYDAVRWAIATGINISCSFMVPFPEDTKETLAETLDFMRSLQDLGATLLISYTTPFPGTMFAEKAEQLGLRILTDDWSLYDAKHIVMETKHLSAAEIESQVTSMAESLGMRRSA